MVTETQQDEKTEVASNDVTAEEQSTATAEAEVEVAESQSSVSDLLSSPEALAEALALPAVQEHMAEAARVAENTGKQKAAAEARRQYGNPEVVENTMLSILEDAGLEKDSITRSMRDKANTLFSTAQRAAADEFADELPRHFFSAYELPQETLSVYQEKLAGRDWDGAFQALVDGAVSQKDSAREADFDKRVKAAASEMAKAELDAASGNGTTPIPATTRGTPTSNTNTSLTTAEIDRMPASAWKRLSDEAKAQIEANVVAADAERGATTVDLGRLEQVTSLAST